MTDPIRRFVDLLDESTIADVSEWRVSRLCYVLLRQLASETTGYPEELLDAIQATQVRRVKIDAAREVTRRNVQIRNGPLVTVVYGLLAVMVAVVTSLAVTITPPGTPGLLIIGTAIVIASLGLLILSSATHWMSPYLTLLDALDGSLRHRTRRSRWRKN